MICNKLMDYMFFYMFFFKDGGLFHWLPFIQNSIGPAKKISEILLNEERKYIIEVVAVQP